ncbi:hypothetical protein Ga0061061_11743 [Chelatococcus sambhunathii]|uniref:Holin n=1 Tax=Chelatococcus sambhunathii TaxID=363953 RepID=A0ABM9UBQ1_9HYPH|nr:hypothetical protein [Chelatococcus sambhunathii]CUA91002.1 hypothetical protein Ga0061061_11743 [Chelatococcus sambhunathii]
MQKVLDFLKGKKRYIAAVAVGVIAAVQYLGIEVPSWIKLALASVGLQ